MIDRCGSQTEEPSGGGRRSCAIKGGQGTQLPVHRAKPLWPLPSTHPSIIISSTAAVQVNTRSLHCKIQKDYNMCVHWLIHQWYLKQAVTFALFDLYICYITSLWLQTSEWHLQAVSQLEHICIVCVCVCVNACVCSPSHSVCVFSLSLSRVHVESGWVVPAQLQLPVSFLIWSPGLDISSFIIHHSSAPSKVY